MAAQWLEDFKKTPESARLKNEPVAYFCSEFALEDRIPTFAGGLGVLAADLALEAGALDFPLIGVGLYYHEGYSEIETLHPSAGPVRHRTQPDEVGLLPVNDKEGKRIIISLTIGDKDIHAQAWIWKYRSMTVYLLDTDIDQNAPQDRAITDKLYVLDKEIHLKQMILLGIGGFRLLQAIGIHPSIYHLNEGHSAFLIFELIRHEMEHREVDFEKALELAREHVVFTNHTLVTAGKELVSNDLVSALLYRYAETELHVPMNDLVQMGLVQDSSLFSITMLSLRVAGISNAVSRLHSKKATEIWTDHPMIQVTNGVNIDRWDRLVSGEPAQIWHRHQENKKEILTLVRTLDGQVWSPETLLVGWARRFASYKRPLALFENIDRLVNLAKNKNRPIKIVYAGLSHTLDDEGRQMISKVKELASGKLDDVLVFLPNYGIGLTQLLTAGCDLWLNTPVVGFEACGTSSMKAALNGALPITTKDGWIDEVELYGIGWVIGSDNVGEEILNTLEGSVVPMYYEHLKSPENSDWINHMQNARDLIVNEFSTSRVLKEYTSKMYLPALTHLHPK